MTRRENFRIAIERAIVDNPNLRPRDIASAYGLSRGQVSGILHRYRKRNGLLRTPPQFPFQPRKLNP